MKKLICFLLGHKYRLKRNITDGIREVKCIRCKSEFSMHDKMRLLIPLDAELSHLGDGLIRIKDNQ